MSTYVKKNILGVYRAQSKDKKEGRRQIKQELTDATRLYHLESNLNVDAWG